MYSIERKTFDRRLFLVRHRLDKTTEMAARAGRLIVSPEAPLGHFLRIVG